MSASLYCRKARLTLAAWIALGAASGALAGDKPATPEGAQNLRAFFDSRLPAPDNSPPLVTVKPDGSNYVVSADLGALGGLLKSAGANVSYDPATLIYKLTEQDDGKWRLVQDSFPKLAARSDEVSSAIDITNSKLSVLIDPALAWWLSGSASADKGLIAMHGPAIDQTIDFGAAKGDYATTVNPDGTVSSTVKDQIEDIGVKATATSEDKKPMAVSAHLDRAAFNIGVDGLKSRKVFDLWSLLAAHRADIAQHEPELKDLLRAVVAPGLKLAEGGEATKALIASPYGAIALAGMKAAVAVENAGPQSAIHAAVGVEGLSLPVGLAPPGAADLMPTRIDLAVSLKGIDITAAANEAIADMHLGGEGPPISDADSAKIAAALLSAGPMRLDIAQSRIEAPAIDADFEGAIRYAVGKPSGSVTIHMRNFDKTMSALKGLGPDLEAKAIPALAMAKGLARNESDGSLTWLLELGEDRSIKVNGIPLGKAPD
jgi:Uncharacterized protein conserved in bacteria (DUF2125)